MEIQTTLYTNISTFVQLVSSA